MKIFKAATGVCGLVVMAALLAPSASASPWNRKTIVKFSGPVEVPGTHLAGWGILPAGTYVFKIFDSQSDRHIVQIFSEDEKTVYATILAVPNYRMQVTDKTVITFTERPAGQPEALRAWFYPGRNYGEEFVYPKARALELAKATNVPVLFTPSEIPAEVNEPIASVDQPVVREMKQAPIRAINPTGEEVQLAAVVTPPPASETEESAETQVAAAPQTDNRPLSARSQSAERQTAPRTPYTPEPMLPATAGNLPMIGLLGLAMLGGAFAIRTVAKRL